MCDSPHTYASGSESVWGAGLCDRKERRREGSTADIENTGEMSALVTSLTIWRCHAEEVVSVHHEHRDEVIELSI